MLDLEVTVSPFPGVTDALVPLFTIALTVTMLCLTFGVPVIVVLLIRALWYRQVNVGKSAELDKLVWQLHRVASALEQPQATAPQAETPTTQPMERQVHLSMFGR